MVSLKLQKRLAASVLKVGGRGLGAAFPVLQLRR
jgi:hypothetical protein